MVGIISVVIGGHFGCGDHFDGGDHFGGGTEAHKMSVVGGRQRNRENCVTGEGGFQYWRCNIGRWDVRNLLLVGVNLNPVLWL